MMLPMNPREPQHIALGLSGGLDSSMAAHLLLEAGWQVTGFVMDLRGALDLPPEILQTGCVATAAQTIAAAQRAAERLGIPCHVLPLGTRFRHDVIAAIRRECMAGRTPNPCAICNPTLKFALLPLAEKAAGHPFAKFATGHYARIRQDAASGRWILSRGVDEKKDQSYFLARLTQEQLAHTIFPLGELRKEDIRAAACAMDWAELAAQSESQDFLGGMGYSLLFDERESNPGDFVDEHGHILGRHRGLVHYTIGQRRGLALGGGGTPWRVASLNPAENTITLTTSNVCTQSMRLIQINRVGLPELPENPFRCQVQIRRQHMAANATITTESGDLLVQFDEAQNAITPGQIGVLYAGDDVLAAGIIA